MKFTLSWLKDHLETDATVSEIADRLTALGLEVESVTDPAEKLAPFVVAHVVEAKPHPNADRLTLCRVDLGNGEPVQIVCGAANVAPGQKVPVATVGTTLAIVLVCMAAIASAENAIAAMDAIPVDILPIYPDEI